MQAVVSPDYLGMLAGSHKPLVTADAWWNGRCVKRSLPIADGSVTVTAGQAIRSTLSLDLRDAGGVLTPRADGVLSPYGGEINIRAGMQRGPVRDLCSLGWFVIEDVGTDEMWRVRKGKEGVEVRVSQGATHSLSGSDRAVRIQDNQFASRTQPAQPTVLLEIARILQGIVPWKPPAWADKALAAGAVTYEDDRLKALTDLADLLDADPIANADGAITLVRKVPPLVSVWTIPRGEGGVLASMDRKLSRTGMHNAVIARSISFDGSPLQGVDYESNPALRWGGPFGRVPLFIDAPLAGTQAEVNRAAAVALQAEQRSRWQEITVTCVANYALEVGDVITLPGPRSGSITGQVTAATYPLKPGRMSITMTVDPFVLAEVS